MIKEKTLTVKKVIGLAILLVVLSPLLVLIIYWILSLATGHALLLPYRLR